MTNCWDFLCVVNSEFATRFQGRRTRLYFLNFGNDFSKRYCVVKHRLLERLHFLKKFGNDVSKSYCDAN